jgi:N-acetylmuramoyl-L-alanine amidase CwlA
MTTVNDYPIRVELIPDLPRIPYRNGIGAWEGVCIHETACPGDSDDSELSYFKKNWRTRQAFVQAFIDQDSQMQTADWSYKSWGCGNGNDRFINIEMCHVLTQTHFDIVYKKTCWLAAVKLFERKLDVIDGKTLVSHKWVADNLGGTDHQDPISYLKKFGKTWADMVRDTKVVYDALRAPISTPKPTTPSNPLPCNIIVLDKDITPDGLILDGRSYVPVRYIAETVLSEKVSWDSVNAQAIVKGTHLETKIIGGLGYVHSVALAKALNLKIEWDNKTRTVYFEND